MALVCLKAFLVTARDSGSLIAPDLPPPSSHALIDSWQHTGDNSREDVVGELCACMIGQEELAPDTTAWVAAFMVRSAEYNVWAVRPSLSIKTVRTPPTVADRLVLIGSLPIQRDDRTGPYAKRLLRIGFFGANLGIVISPMP